MGIPLCLSVLADIGQLLATIINKMVEQYKLFVMPVLQKYNIIAQKKKYRTLNHTCLSNNFNCPLPERRRVTRRRMLRKMTMMMMTRAGGCSATSRQPSSASSSSQPSSPWEHTSSAPLKTSHSLMGSTSALSASQPSASGTLYQILKEVD